MSRNKIHLFNPENDLALALGCRHYTPPPHAAALHRAGALLPAWWADDGDAVIASDPCAEDDAQWLASRWGIAPPVILPAKAKDTAPPHAAVTDNPAPAPWGWSDDARRQFMMAGVAKGTLPSDSTISRLRMLSHRRSSIAILTALGATDLLPAEITDPSDALTLEAESPGCFFKSPWSCSGRGVFCAGGLPEEVLRSKVEGIIHRQGSVMCERGYRKKAEFGALIESDGSSVRFRGLSMFLTEGRGAYTGNIVAPQDYFADSLDSLGLLSELQDTATALESVLATLLCPVYRGWLGIDMMAYTADDGTTHLHPCIELNLRMTMGVAAMKVAERISPDRPMLMAWQRGTPQPGTTLMLPPREGFALTLTPLCFDFNNTSSL